MQEEELQAAFRAFTLFGHGAGAGGKPAAVEMDGRSFAKLARDCGLLGAHLTPAQVDIIFSKVKAKARPAVLCSLYRPAANMDAGVLAAHRPGNTLCY